MNSQSRFRSPLRFAPRTAIAVLALGSLTMLIPALALAVKVKDGAYAGSGKGSSGYVATSGGKVTGGSANLIFKGKGGSKCSSAAIVAYTTGGVTSLPASPKKPVKPKNDKFGYSDETTGQIKMSVKGKFKSSSRASLKFRASVDGCKAKADFKNAKYTSGG